MKPEQVRLEEVTVKRFMSWRECCAPRPMQTERRGWPWSSFLRSSRRRAI